MSNNSQPGWRGLDWAGRFLNNKAGALLASFVFTLGMIHSYVFPLNAFPYSGWFGNDCYQMTWDLWFVNESITHGHNPYVTNLIYYPYGANLSHHTLAVGFFPVTFLVKLFSGGDPMYPVYAYKIIILLSFTLILYFSYLLLREMEMSRWVAAIAAVAYTFCDFYTLHAQHINHLAGFFIPLTALLLVRFYKRPDSRRLVIAAAISACSIYFTEFALYIYLGVFLFGGLMFVFPRERQLLLEKLRRAGVRQLMVAAGLFVLIQTPFALNLLRDNVLRPGYSESSHFSANLAGFFIPSKFTPLYGKVFSAVDAKITQGIGGFEVFVGFPLLVFAVIGLVRARHRLIWFSAITSLAFFVLSLGPTLKALSVETGWRLPYYLLMRVPFFDQGRTPVRFFAAALFLLTPVSAWGMSRIQLALARRWNWRWSSAVMALLFVWTSAESYSPFSSPPPFVPPRGLGRIVAGPVLNLPAYSNDGYAALLQVFHHQPIGTGYTARMTRTRVEQFRHLKRATDRGGQALCDRAKEMGFRNIIINPRQMVLPERWNNIASLDLSHCSINVVDLRDEATPLGGSYAGMIEKPDAFPAYVPGTRIELRSSAADRYLWYGWSAAEPEFRWSAQARATIIFSLNELNPAVLKLQMGTFLSPGKLDQQRVFVALNGRQIATLNIRQDVPQEYSFNLPVESLRDHNVLTFDLPDAEAPANLGPSEDERLLGISLNWIEIDPATVATNPQKPIR